MSIVLYNLLCMGFVNLGIDCDKLMKLVSESFGLFVILVSYLLINLVMFNEDLCFSKSFLVFFSFFSMMSVFRLNFWWMKYWFMIL